MVIALGNELAHLLKRVRAAVCHVHRDVGDLRPDHETVLVAEIVEFLRVLIVRKSERVGADLADDRHVGPVVFEGKRIALAFQVLVARDAAERITAAVQEEAFFRVEIKGAAAEAGGDLVAGFEPGSGGIEEGILNAVPEMHVFDDKFSGGMTIHGRHGLRFTVDGHGDGRSVLPGLDRDDGTAGSKIDDRRHFDAGGAVLYQFKMLLRHGNQPHFPVQAAVEGEIGLLGIDAVGVAIVHRNG